MSERKRRTSQTQQLPEWFRLPDEIDHALNEVFVRFLPRGGPATVPRAAEIIRALEHGSRLCTAAIMTANGHEKRHATLGVSSCSYADHLTKAIAALDGLSTTRADALNRRRFLIVEAKENFQHVYKRLRSFHKRHLPRGYSAEAEVRRREFRSRVHDAFRAAAWIASAGRLAPSTHRVVFRLFGDVLDGSARPIEAAIETVRLLYPDSTPHEIREGARAALGEFAPPKGALLVVLLEHRIGQLETIG